MERRVKAGRLFRSDRGLPVGFLGLGILEIDRKKGSMFIRIDWKGVDMHRRRWNVAHDAQTCIVMYCSSSTFG